MNQDEAQGPILVAAFIAQTLPDYRAERLAAVPAPRRHPRLATRCFQ